MTDIVDGLDEMTLEMENTQIDDLETEDVNLMFLAIDESISMEQYVSIMKEELRKFKTAIQNSKESEKILVSRANFSNFIRISGYKRIDEFDINYEVQMSTRLYDVILEGAEALLAYMKHLKTQGMRVNGVFAIFSDGFDTCSRTNISNARRMIEQLNQMEIVTVFVAFGGEALEEAKRLSINNILEIGKTETELRNAFNQLSKSLISQSKSVVPKDNDFFEM